MPTTATTPNLPAWFVSRREAARTRFESLPAPARGDEPWRFSNFKQLDFAGFTKTGETPPADGIVDRSNGLDKPAAKFIFINDRLVSSHADLPPGVICMPLDEALASHGDLVEAHFMKRETRLGSANYAAWHEANVSNGLFVFVPDNVEVVGAIEVHHWIHGNNSLVFPHTLIVTGTHARVRVVDYFRSTTELEPGLAVAINDLCAGPGSMLDYVAVQAVNEVTRVIQINDTAVARDASAKGFILNTGASWVRNESVSRLEGSNSRSDMLSVSIPAREQEYDQRTFQHHVSPGAYSDLLYKNSLYDHSKTIFSGLIFVDEGAHYTDAYQTCRNLMMTDTCEANSMPGLEINADQVKCSHGSTTARISDEEIFYLRARGIHPDRARQMIALGFSLEVVERLDHPEIAEMLLGFIAEKMSRIAAS